MKLKIQLEKESRIHWNEWANPKNLCSSTIVAFLLQEGRRKSELVFFACVGRNGSLALQNQPASRSHPTWILSGKWGLKFHYSSLEGFDCCTQLKICWEEPFVSGPVTSKRDLLPCKSWSDSSNLPIAFSALICLSLPQACGGRQATLEACNFCSKEGKNLIFGSKMQQL